MTRKSRMTLHSALAALVGAGALMVAEPSRLGQQTLVASADARIGRPLTPLSYAGVARRTTRRAIYGGAVVGAPVVVRPPVVAPRGCAQVVDAYGRVITRCY